ncbi:MAG: hypothetical protein PF961_19005 [Planctomycetota bacterium]|nr:hypothetical protein [Planctomycetota bacterium]
MRSDRFPKDIEMANNRTRQHPQACVGRLTIVIICGLTVSALSGCGHDGQDDGHGHNDGKAPHSHMEGHEKGAGSGMGSAGQEHDEGATHEPTPESETANDNGQ